MKINRISLIAALALGGLIACSTMVSAQDAPKKGKRGPTIEQLTESLKLTDEQKPKVQAVLDEGAKKRAELRDLPQDERREKMQAFMEEQNKKMKDILTSEQYEKWQAMRPGRPGGKKADSTKSQ
jgi:hypothetical protein